MAMPYFPLPSRPLTTLRASLGGVHALSGFDLYFQAVHTLNNNKNAISNKISSPELNFKI